MFKHALKPKPSTIDSTATSYTFPVGLASNGRKQELAFRLLLLQKGQVGKTRSVVYWQVDGGSLDAAINNLKQDGYALLGPSQQPATSNQATLVDTIEIGDTAVALAGINSGSGRMMGLVVNPPYPTMTKTDSTAKVDSTLTIDTTGKKTSNPGNGAGSPAYWLWLGCLLCLVLGVVIGRIWKK